MSEREELIKRLQDKIIKTICTGLPGPNACKAPDCECYEGNGKPIFRAIEPLFIDLIAAKSDSAKSAPCPRCYGDGPHAECELCHGSGYCPPISALAAQQEPVAWIHEVTDGDEQSLALSFSPDSFPLDTLTGWKSTSHRPLIYGDTAPLSGVREGMLLKQALPHLKEFSKTAKYTKDGEQKKYDYTPDGLDDLIEAITRAADQVNAEGRLCNLGCTVSCGNCDYMPAPSDRPADAVVVPREQLEHWAEYWNGNANEKAMSDALEHILGEVADILRAAQEAK